MSLPLTSTLDTPSRGGPAVDVLNVALDTTTLDLPSRGGPARGLAPRVVDTRVSTSTLDITSRGGPSLGIPNLLTGPDTATLNLASRGGPALYLVTGVVADEEVVTPPPPPVDEPGVASRGGAPLGILLASLDVTTLDYAERGGPSITLSATAPVDPWTNLGIPARVSDQSGYARNIWDLIRFDGQIHVACGNYSNSGPNPHAGPVTMVRWDPATQVFLNGTTSQVDDEQLLIFRDLGDGYLWGVGCDPRFDDALHLYRFHNGAWDSGHYNASICTLHGFDLALVGSRYLFGISIDGTHTYSGTKNVLYATDPTNNSWANPAHSGGGVQAGALSWRCYSFFSLGGVLYTSGDHPPGFEDGNQYHAMMAYNSSTNTFTDQSKSIRWGMFGGTITERCRMYRTTNFGSNIAYIRAISQSDLSADVGEADLWICSTIGSGSLVTLNGETPRDIVTSPDGSTLYVVGHETIGGGSGGSTVNVLYQTTDLSTWTEVVRFNDSTFARSLEVLDGSFYFALGSDQGTVSADTGRIWRYTP